MSLANIGLRQMGYSEGTRAVRTAVSGRHMLRTAFFGTFLQDSAVRGRCKCPTLFSVIRNIGRHHQMGGKLDRGRPAAHGRGGLLRVAPGGLNQCSAIWALPVPTLRFRFTEYWIRNTEYWEAQPDGWETRRAGSTNCEPFSFGPSLAG